VRFIMSLRAGINNELTTKKDKWNPGKRVLIYLLDRDVGLNNTAIAGLLDGLYSSGIWRMILAGICNIKPAKTGALDRTSHI
jgi:hypothetical protein